MKIKGGTRPLLYTISAVLIMGTTILWAALALRWRWPPFENSNPAVGWAIFFAYTSIATIISGILIARYARRAIASTPLHPG